MHFTLRYNSRMLYRSERQNGVPIIILPDKQQATLARIQLNEKEFNEFWVQELIRENPQVLPIAKLETIFAPAIPIGREVNTAVGPLDNLYISPEGYITIVETKLWRNPEARREVVGQIIDYAQDISTWDYEKLDTTVKAYNQKYSGVTDGIIETVGKQQELDTGQERELIDTISRNLRKGRFLLLIVGDGIREEVEALTDFLNRSAQLQFTLGLVELQIYRVMEGGNKDALLVIPQVVMRTREISRAVVTIDEAAMGKVKVDINVAEEPAKQKRISITEEEYFDKLERAAGNEVVTFAKQLIADMEELGCLIDWKTASFVVKYPDPAGSGTNFTIFVSQKNGNIYVYWLSGQFKAMEMDPAIAQGFVNNLAKLLKKKINPKVPDAWIGTAPLTKVQKVYPAFKSHTEEFIARINSIRK